MNHYYYYVIAGRECGSDTKILKISIGSSLQGRRDFLFLTAYSVEHGHYFELVSDRSDEFISRLRQSLLADGVSMEYCSGRSLVRLLKTGDRPTLSNAQLLSADAQLRALNIDYRIMSNLRRRDHSSAKRGR